MRISDIIFREPKNPPYVEWKLRVTRMKKFLENARAFLSLIEDGREKLANDYIIDERYVFSLVERVMERTGMMVFDACVLVREGGGELYRALDAYWAAARREFLAPIPKAGAESAEEPEVTRLKSAIKWMEAGNGGQEPLLGFFRKIVGHLVTGLGAEKPPAAGISNLALKSGAGAARVSILDLDRAAGSEAASEISATDVACRPLGLLLMGAGASGAAPEGLFAAVDSDHASVFAQGPKSRFLWIAATLSGHSDADFVFALGRGLSQNDFPGGFRVETSGEWAFGWIYDVDMQSIEESLTGLGKKLFA